MIDEQKLSEALEKLGQKLGVAAEHVYAVLVSQMKAESISGLVMWSCVFLVCLFLTAVLIKKGKDVTEDDVGLLLAGLVFFFALNTISLAFIRYNILKFINPEYYALKEIFEMLTGTSS